MVVSLYSHFYPISLRLMAGSAYGAPVADQLKETVMEYSRTGRVLQKMGGEFQDTSEASYPVDKSLATMIQVRPYPCLPFSLVRTSRVLRHRLYGCQALMIRLN